MHKVPTTIAYDANGIPSNWGFRNTASQDTLKWFKLLLIDKQDLPVHLRWATELEEARGLMKKLKKNAVEVISEYLRLLWADASEQISQLHGAPFMSRSSIMKGSLRYVLIRHGAMGMSLGCHIITV